MKIKSDIGSKIKAGALQYAVIISVIIALFTSFFIYAVFLNTKLTDSFIVRDKLLTNIQSAISQINYSASGFSRQTTSFFVGGDSTCEVKLNRRLWGMYSLLEISSKTPLLQEKEFVLEGTIMDSSFSSIYLTDNGNYLSLSGKTRIVGDCSLPEYGVRSGYIGREGFSGFKLIEGNWKKSNRKLPDISKVILANIDTLFNRCEALTLKNIESIDSSYFRQSFDAPTRVFSCGYLDGDRYVGGNIVLFSRGIIKISEHSFPDNCIILADEIIIESGFSGCAQFFARKKITVEKNVYLNYPSVLAVIESDESKTKIFVDKDVIFAGIILCLNLSNTENVINVDISEDTQIYGLLYSTGVLQLKGNVRGAVYCDRFLYVTPSRSYMNHLHNVNIEKCVSPDMFCLPFIFEEQKTVKIFKRNL